MKASAVVALARSELDDVAEPQLWPNATLLAYLAEAQMEACMRADIIWDGSSSFCAISVAANATSAALDSRVTRVEWAGWDDGAVVTPLQFVDQRDADQQSQSWRTYAGTPSALIAAPSALRFVTKPAAAGTLRLEVYRMPLKSTLVSSDDIEVPDRWAHLLRDWILHRAYEARDADKGDRQRSAKAFAQFEATFGSRPTVYAQAQRSARRSPLIRPRGF